MLDRQWTMKEVIVVVEGGGGNGNKRREWLEAVIGVSLDFQWWAAGGVVEGRGKSGCAAQYK
jgi:hypothetical protein